MIVEGIHLFSATNFFIKITLASCNELFQQSNNNQEK